MSYREQLEKLIIEKKGLIITKEVEEAGIPRYYLTSFTRENKLERATYGVYLTREAFEDDMYTLQAKSKRVIFSHETALYLHELTDRDPLEWSVTIPYGYNGSNLRKSGIKVYTVKKELHLMGVTELKTLYGRPIKVYDKERTICDIVRNRNNMDVAILNEGIKRYLDSKDKNIPLLLRYAKALDIQNIIRNYMEILL
ncbi:type IV toxin-antitoxin system AbiEi family antitoxin domain-containing protein [Clostridium estertheticum]|uniref:type IV toxin-antitoxin system AbiEi family antitoxin domain-containing protein n=1 Tax=Clostridium estertheticum TaxID=238834 RepID=UPI0013EEAA57|nr:type IV toxin-antitoxin system AbiEi family antitoxin domain-containing protein [Clostridium estertheticum]MBZ9606309.1 type IV toxin-antitoxin system AbiEi family antitoxin domain-containing protein [Clostridium estertheticum]